MLEAVVLPGMEVKEEVEAVPIEAVVFVAAADVAAY